MLEKRGYRIVESEDYEKSREEGGKASALLRLVDERRLAEVPDEGPSSLPIIMLTGRVGAVGADSRVVGALRRPAGVHELYRLVQQISEDTPRSTPRVPVHIPASCRTFDEDCRVVLLSLSENGCLLRTPEPLLLGSTLQLSFKLPGVGRVELGTEVAYQLVPDVGLIFHAVRPDLRRAICDFVTEALSGP